MKLTENFNLAEFACKDGTEVPQKFYINVKDLAVQLQVLRDYLGVPVHINSAYRTPKHNKAVGGATNSMHLKAMAADITVRDFTPKEVHEAITHLISEKKMRDGGLGLYKGFVHYDIGKPRRWNY